MYDLLVHIYKKEKSYKNMASLKHFKRFVANCRFLLGLLFLFLCLLYSTWWKRLVSLILHRICHAVPSPPISTNSSICFTVLMLVTYGFDNTCSETYIYYLYTPEGTVVCGYLFRIFIYSCLERTLVSVCEVSCVYWAKGDTWGPLL